MKLISKKLTNHDHSPHYLVDGEKFYSRLYAQRKAQSLCKQDPDAVWGKIQYVVPLDVSGSEPKTVIRELYKQRARQIRQDYEYVRIWASGGCDSTHIIYAFKEAGVEPNELATYLQYPGSVSPTQNLEVEIGYNKLLSKIKEWWPNCKIKYYNILPEHYNWYSKNAVDHYFAYTMLHPPAFSWQIPYEVYPELQDCGEKYKTVDLYGGMCFSIGEDSNGYYYYFIDKDSNMALNAPYQEYFFTSPEHPELFLKMAHCVKKYLIEKNILEQHKDNSINISNIDTLDFWYPDNYYISSKGHKKLTGILDHGQKGSLRWLNMISSLMGQETTINFLAHLKKMGDDNPHWFHNGKIAEDFIGMRSKKIYFEEKK